MKDVELENKMKDAIEIWIKGSEWVKCKHCGKRGKYEIDKLTISKEMFDTFAPDILRVVKEGQKDLKMLQKRIEDAMKD